MTILFGIQLHNRSVAVDLAIVSALVLIWAVGGHAQSQATKIVVVPVDPATTTRLADLKSAAERAQKAYDDAVTEAKRRLLTTRDKQQAGQGGWGKCQAFRENEKEPTTTWLMTGSVFSRSISEPYCLTEDEKAAQRKREKQAEADAVKYDMDHPWRYWLAGYCEGSVFTDDFKYLVPEPVKPALSTGWGNGLIAAPMAVIN